MTGTALAKMDGSQQGTSGGCADGLLGCGCNVETIRAFHAYLSEQFPGYVLRHFHAPTRVMRPGLPTTPADYHVITIAHADVLPYSVVLMENFQDWSVQEVGEHLRQWDLAGTVRGYRIAVVCKDGVAAL